MQLGCIFPHLSVVYFVANWVHVFSFSPSFLFATFHGEIIVGVKPPHRHAYCFCDLKLHPMTLKYEFDLHILTLYERTKMKC